MKLQTLKSVLERTLPLLHIKVSPVVINGTQYAKVEDFEDAKTAIAILGGMNLFPEEVNYLLTSSLIEYSNVNSFNTNFNAGEEINNALSRIKLKATDFLALLNDVLPQVNQDSVFVKFGEVKDLKDLAISASNFNKIFEQIILEPEIGGSIQIKSVDNGSIWIEISFGTKEAVALIGAVSYAAAFLYREYQKSQILAETRQTKKLTNDRLEKLNEANALLLDELVDSEADKIENEFFSTKNNERHERIKNTIRLISDEYKKGAEIQASLTAPTELQKFFPDMKNLMTLSPRTKELGTGKQE